jgi:hypothetical protein
VYKTLAGMKINKSHGCDCSWCLEWPGMKVEGKMMEDDRNLCCLIFRALWREWFFDSQTFLLMECWSRKIRALRFSDQLSSGWKTPVGWEFVPGLWYCCGGTYGAEVFQFPFSLKWGAKKLSYLEFANHMIGFYPTDWCLSSTVG